MPNISNTLKLPSKKAAITKRQSGTQSPPENKAADPPTTKDDFTFSNIAKDSGEALLQSGKYALGFLGKGAAHVGRNIGRSVLNVAGRFAKDTAIMGGGAALGAAISAGTLAVAGPLAGLAVVAGVGVATGVAHQVMAPPHPEDVGLSARAKAHNRFVDSAVVGGLTSCAALVGLAGVGGIGLAATTGAIGGVIGSAINQVGEALGLLRKS